jgi:hypothetical protein
MRKLLFLLFTQLFLCAFPDTYEIFDNGELVVDGIKYELKTYKVTEHGEYYDDEYEMNIADVVGALPDVTEVSIPAVVSRIWTDADGISHTIDYRVRNFNAGSGFAGCSKLEHITLGMKEVRLHSGMPLGPNFSVSPGFPSRNINSIEMSEETYFILAQSGTIIYKEQDGTKSLLYVPGGYKAYSIPSIVRGILSYAFLESSIKELVIPSSVEWVSSDAFYESDIETLVLSTKTLMFKQSLSGCKKLKALVISDYDNTGKREYGWLEGVDESVIIYALPYEFDRIRDYWHGELRTLELEPTIESYSFNRGRLQFKIQDNPMIKITNVGFGIHYDDVHFSVNEDNAYDLSVSPMLKTARLFLIYEVFNESHSKSVELQQTNCVDLGIDLNTTASTATLRFSPQFNGYDKKVIDYGVRFYDSGVGKEIIVPAKDNVIRVNPSLTTESSSTKYFHYTPYIKVLEDSNEVVYYGYGSDYVYPPVLKASPKVISNTPTEVQIKFELNGDIQCESASFSYKDYTGWQEGNVDNLICAIETDVQETGHYFNFEGASLRLKYNVSYGDYSYQTTATLPIAAFSVQQEGLQLTTLPAEKTSNDRAEIRAEVNLPDFYDGTGFEWIRYDAPDLVPPTKVSCPVVGGRMSGMLKNLSSGTYYKYRPYFEGSDGTMHYGDWIAFGTADAYVYFEPTVSTLSPSEITEESAELCGYALAGSDDVLEQGFEYWKVAESRAAGEVHKVFADGERMTATLSNLDSGTRYCFRAFVTTAKETTYGSEREFTTAGEKQSGMFEIESDADVSATFNVYSLSGVCVRRNATSLDGLRPGIYIANGRKLFVR